MGVRKRREFRKQNLDDSNQNRQPVFKLKEITFEWWTICKTNLASEHTAFKWTSHIQVMNYSFYYYFLGAGGGDVSRIFPFFCFDQDAFYVSI